MTKFVIILGFVVSFAAGLVVGSRRALVSESPANSTDTSSAETSSATRPSPAGGGSERRSRSGFLTAELGLTPGQRGQLDKIWSAMAKANDQDDLRRGYRRERDAAIADLVPPARLGEYDAIINTYHGRIDALEQQTRAAYHDAVEQTKAILTPEQRTRYEDLLKRHRWGRENDSNNSNNARRSETRATSQPGGNEPNTLSHESLKGASR